MFSPYVVDIPSFLNEEKKGFCYGFWLSVELIPLPWTDVQENLGFFRRGKILELWQIPLLLFSLPSCEATEVSRKSSCSTFGKVRNNASLWDFTPKSKSSSDRGKAQLGWCCLLTQRMNTWWFEKTIKVFKTCYRMSFH